MPDRPPDDRFEADLAAEREDYRETARAVFASLRAGPA